MRLKDIVLIVAVASLLLSSGCIGQDEKVVDSDGDGWDDEQELVAGTDPNNVDTDGDGYWDSKDENPLDPNIPAPRETPTPVEAATPIPRPTTSATPTITHVFEITDPADGDSVPRLIDVRGHGGMPGAKVRIHVYIEDEGDILRPAVGYVDEDGNWEIEDIGLWDVTGYTIGDEAMIYAVMTVSQAGDTIIRASENVTVYRV
ncbi:MAG: hypothetical protein C5S52_01710 [ANME-2 cluster archaeon]|nr:hypothetical protein [ANME-2 cluster archaeon]